MSSMMAAFLTVLWLPSPTTAPQERVDYPEDLRKWIAAKLPKGFENYSTFEWDVFLRDGVPLVRLRPSSQRQPDDALPFEIEGGTAQRGLVGRRFCARVADGWIVGFNAGEFGAGLWWFSPDGKTRYKISEDQVSGFVPIDAGLLAIEGLAHMGLNRGRIIRVAQDAKRRWRSENFVDLKHAPRVAAKDADGSLIVATTNQLLRVDPASKKVDVLLDPAFWRGLYPGSMIITPSGTIYLGMRHGVAEAEKKGGTYKFRWLLPSEEYAKIKPRL